MQKKVFRDTNIYNTIKKRKVMKMQYLENIIMGTFEEEGNWLE